MRVLAIDTSVSACSVAVLDAAADEPVSARTMRMDRGHAEALMPLLAGLVEAAGGLGTIDRLVVTTGPGSFTGIRVGLSAARALALATATPLVGITTLAALAAPLLDFDDGVPAAAAISARHERVFFQMFGPGARGLVPARLIPIREAARAAGTGRVRLAGSGAAEVAGVAGEGGFEVVSGLDVPDPVWLARLGAAADIPARPPRPLYLAPADARPQHAGRIARL